MGSEVTIFQLVILNDCFNDRLDIRIGGQNSFVPCTVRHWPFKKRHFNLGVFPAPDENPSLLASYDAKLKERLSYTLDK